MNCGLPSILFLNVDILVVVIELYLEHNSGIIRSNQFSVNAQFQAVVGVLY